MANLVARVKNLLLSPNSEWDVIDREAIRSRNLVLGYVIPLAALPAAATVFGLSVLGVDVAGETVRAPWIWMLASAALFFAMSVLGVLVFAALLNALAPTFGAERNYAQALKVSGYSITSAMVAGIATAVPALGIIALIGASYSLYLLFLGVPRLMKPAPNSATNYSIVATACALVLGLLVGLVAMTTIGPSAHVLFPQLASIPGMAAPSSVATVASAPAAPSPLPAPMPVVSPSGLVSTDALKALAPEKLVGFDRVSLGVEASGLANSQSVSLDAEYRRGKRFIELEITHSATIATLIGFGGPATSEYDRETAEGYSRRRREGAAIVAEEWNRASKSGSYARLTDDQFYVKASGGDVTPEELKQAVESFSAERLAQLERAP
ncbi:MAG: Yip1 family protein [Alphaproteobacteria bacterium]